MADLFVESRQRCQSIAFRLSPRPQLTRPLFATAPQYSDGLLGKIYEVDPLICPRCLGPMKIVAVIEQPETIRYILQHLKLWERPQRAPPPPRLFSHKLDQLLASLSPEQARQLQFSTDSIFWDDVPTWPDG